METAYYSTLVKVALTKDSESVDPVQNLDQVISLILDLIHKFAKSCQFQYSFNL